MTKTLTYKLKLVVIAIAIALTGVVAGLATEEASAMVCERPPNECDDRLPN